MSCKNIFLAYTVHIQKLLNIFLSIIMKKDFFLFRHGQTDLNVQGRWQGSTSDALLNQTGKEQAEILRQTIISKNLQLDKLYSSPLLRAVQTANIIADQGWHRLNYMVLHDLREGNFGECEGLTFEESRQKYGDELIDTYFNPTFDTWDVKFPGGESKHEIFKRVQSCLKYIFQINPWIYDNRLGIVCHAGVISSLKCGLNLKEVSCENCSILHLRYDTDTEQFTQILD